MYGLSKGGLKMDRELLEMRKDLVLCKEIERAAEVGKDITHITADDTEFLYEEEYEEEEYEEEEETEYISMWDNHTDFLGREAQIQAELTYSMY